MVPDRTLTVYIAIAALALCCGCVQPVFAQKPDPNDPVGTGMLYEKKGFMSLAQEQYEKALKCGKDTPQAYKSLAMIHLQNGKQDAARSLMAQAAKKYPKDYGVLLTAGYVDYAAKKYDQAMALYQRADAVSPNRPDLHAAMADAYGQMHQYEKALAESNKTLQLDPKSTVGNYEKAMALISLKRYPEAVDPLTKNFHAEPTNRKSTNLYMQLMLQLKRPSDAFEALLCLLAVAEGKNMDNIKQGVGGYIDLFPSPESEQRIQMASNDLKGTPEIAARMHFALGDVYDRREKYDKAMQQYREGLTLDPKFARGYLRLAEDQEFRKNDLFAALPNYKKAYDLKPDDAEIETRYQAVQKKIQNDWWLKTCSWFNGLCGQK